MSVEMRVELCMFRMDSTALPWIAEQNCAISHAEPAHADTTGASCPTQITEMNGAAEL